GSDVASTRLGRLFGRERPKIFPYFQIHPVNLGEEPSRRHAIVLGVGFRFADFGHLPLEVTDALLRGFKFPIVLNHGPITSMIPRFSPPRLICQWAIVASSPPSAAARRSQKILAPSKFCAAEWSKTRRASGETCRTSNESSISRKMSTSLGSGFAVMKEPKRTKR